MSVPFSPPLNAPIRQLPKMNMAEFPEPILDFEVFADELLAEQAGRSLVIIGSSKIDQLLREILAAHLLPKRAKAKDQDEIIDGDNPLGTFSSRIKICFRLGLIHETLFDDLERLRAVRNKGAHLIAYRPTQPPIRDLLHNLQSKIEARGSFHLTKDRFFREGIANPIERLQCNLLTICVLLEVVRTTMPRTLGYPHAVDISAK